MKARWMLAALPFVAAAVVGALMQAVQGGPDETVTYRAVTFVGTGLAAWGALVAAFTFGKGDYLRRAWLLTAGCYVMLFLKRVVFVLASGAPGGSHLLDWVGGGMTLVANASGVAGMVLVARAYQVAGLDLTVKRSTRVLAVALSAVLAFAVVGKDVWEALLACVGGDPTSLQGLASSLGDVVSLTLIAPVLLTAFALRGGALAWPWGVFTVSCLGWLFYDAVLLAGTMLPVTRGELRPLEEALRALACIGCMSAGLLQRRALAATEVAPATAPA